MATELIVLALVVFGAIVVLITQGVKTIPQGYEAVVQRFGEYTKTLKPGLNIIVPFIDKVTYVVTTKDIVLDIPSQEVITKDNAVIVANAVAYIQINTPHRAVYGVENYELAIQKLVQTTLRSIVGTMSLDESLSSREIIKARLQEAISNDINEWGITLKTVEIQDINPSHTMQQAMEEQASAERARRATVTRAEGEKEAQILEADGRLEASRRDAEAQIVISEASQKAIENVTAAVGSNEMPVVYLLGEKYINALQDLSQSGNTKTMILPADLPAAIKNMIGK